MKKALYAAMAGAAMVACACNGGQKKAAQTTETTEPEVEFIRLNVPINIDPANVETATVLAKQLIEASLKDAGVMEYDMFKSETRDNYLLIYETWKDQASLDTHSAAPHFTSLVPQIQEQGEMAIEQFLQVAEPEKDGKQIRINCHIVTKDDAENKAAVMALCKELVAASQSDKGMIQYDILSSVTRPTELMIYETWTDQASLDVHSASEHFTRLVPQIQALAAGMAIEQFYM